MITGNNPFLHFSVVPFGHKLKFNTSIIFIDKTTYKNLKKTHANEMLPRRCQEIVKMTEWSRLFIYSVANVTSQQKCIRMLVHAHNRFVCVEKRMSHLNVFVCIYSWCGRRRSSFFREFFFKITAKCECNIFVVVSFVLAFVYSLNQCRLRLGYFNEFVSIRLGRRSNIKT